MFISGLVIIVIVIDFGSGLVVDGLISFLESMDYMLDIEFWNVVGNINIID